MTRNKKNIGKDITFIYSDSAEKAIFEPLAKEAQKRGYKITFTKNPFERCEIGIYCQHINFPQYSKFSLIMLHDIIQQYGNWPDIWFNEPWNKYDIGILPSTQWVNNWAAVSDRYYTRPRIGIYEVGWPKADTIIKLKDSNYRKKFYEQYNLDPSKPTILYAPSWENDNKQDEFVRAMKTLDVNIIIKQADYDVKKYPIQVENVLKMKKLHENIPGVIILPPETNIFLAIAASDILVSEESSTMCEATMMGIPAVSVSDWFIPDVKPSRLPKCDYNFVYTTQKAKLAEKVKDILDNYSSYKKQTEEFSNLNFSNIGNSSAMIMDIIDDCVNRSEIRYKALVPKNKKRLSFSRYFKHCLVQFRRQSTHNYAINHKIYGVIWRGLKKFKNIILPQQER